MFAALTFTVLLIGRLVRSFNVQDVSRSTLFTNGNGATDFGYSVALHANNEGKWLLVGAPKDYDPLQRNDSGGSREGALYFCPLDEVDKTEDIKDVIKCSRVDMKAATFNRRGTVLFSTNFEKNNLTQQRDDEFDWEAQVGPTKSDQTGPSYDHTVQRRDSGTYMLLECSHPRAVGETARITTPSMPPTDAVCVRFWYHMLGVNMGTLNVYHYTNSTGSRMVWSIEHDQGDKWHEGWVTVIPQGPYKIILEGVVGQDYNSDIGLDDVKILEGPCTEDSQPGSQSLGMTLSTDSQTGQVMACAPTWSYSCKGRNHAAGLCYLFDKDLSLTNPRMLAPCRSSSCGEGKMDLIFLIDGSDSVNVFDFEKMLRWLSNIISSLPFGDDQTRVGIAQYSIKPQAEFYLNEHTTVEDIRKGIKKIKYAKGATATGRAIDFISEEMFTTRRGMRPDAKHVAVVVTDGKSQDDVIPPSKRAKAKGITLFAIGVGVAVDAELRNISSDPDEQFVYSVNSYKALDGIRGQLQKKLFALESQGSTVTTEKCQAGISASFLSGQPVIGMPGLNDWSGGFAMYRQGNFHILRSDLKELLRPKTYNNTVESNSGKADDSEILSVHVPGVQSDTSLVSPQLAVTKFHEWTQTEATPSYSSIFSENSNMEMRPASRVTKNIPLSRRSIQGSSPSEEEIKKMITHAYFGYSMSSGSYSHLTATELAIGAPRYESKGKVFIIRLNRGGLPTPVDSFTGEQMGSYFGYSVCMMDMNGDGMDEVVVGAPLFVEKYQDMGQVVIYISDTESKRVSNKLARFKVTLTGSSERNARFGFSVASAGDLNGDDLGDIVIGAPSHKGGDGAVYIYNGRKDMENLKLPSQIVRSSAMQEKLQYFGFSLHGGIDVDENGYPDIACGAPGTGDVIVMVTRPVVHVKASLISFPSVIHTSEPSCHINSLGSRICSLVKICFDVTGKRIPSIVSLQYSLGADTDQYRTHARAQFIDPQSEIAVIAGDSTCFNATLLFKDPVYDISSDVALTMRYDLSDKMKRTGKSPMLNVHDQNPVRAVVRLVTNCENENCKSDLKVRCYTPGVKSYNGEPSLLLKENRMIGMNLNVTNYGDDAFYVRIQVRYHGGVYLSHIEQSRKCAYIERDEDEIVLEEGESQCGQCNETRNATATSETSKTLILRLINPAMRKHTSCAMKLQFGISKQSGFYDSPLRISVTAESSNQDLHPSDNSCSISYPVYFIGRVSLFGHSEKEEVEFSKENLLLNNASIGYNRPKISYSYLIENKGHAQIPSSSVKVHWPSRMKDGRDVLYLTTVECLPQPKCVCEDVKLYNLNITDDFRKRIESAMNMNVTASEFKQEKRKYHEAWVTCDEDKIGCDTLHCALTDMEPSDTFKLSLDFRILELTLIESNIWRARITTTAEYTAEESPPSVLLKPPPPYKVTVTAFSPRGHSEDEVGPVLPRIWVIILASVTGLLLLALLILALYKSGFFESKYRRKKEETLEWRDFGQTPNPNEDRIHYPEEDEENPDQNRVSTFQRSNSRGNPSAGAQS